MNSARASQSADNPPPYVALPDAAQQPPMSQQGVILSGSRNASSSVNAHQRAHRQHRRSSYAPKVAFPILPAGAEPARVVRQRIAQETVSAMTAGSYSIRGTPYDLARSIDALISGIVVYAPDCVLDPPQGLHEARTLIEVVNMTTLDAVRWIDKEHTVEKKKHNERKGKAKEGTRDHDSAAHEYSQWDYGVDVKQTVEPTRASDAPPPVAVRIGVLNSASPHIPGGAFRGGDAGQEPSVARASTLIAALEDRAAQGFYRAGERAKAEAERIGGVQTSLEAAYHTHAMVYTPGVTVFRDERGAWTPPRDIDVITCAAVHAGDARAVAAGPRQRSRTGEVLPMENPALVEQRIGEVTIARLARVFAAFARHGLGTLVLPAFGAGTFQHMPAAVGRAYGALLIAPGAPFAGVFERVVFAIPGTPGEEFGTAFWATGGARRGQRNSSVKWMRRSVASPPAKESHTVRPVSQGGGSDDNTTGATTKKRHNPNHTQRSFQDDPALADGRSVFSIQDGMSVHSGVRGEHNQHSMDISWHHWRRRLQDDEGANPDQ